MPPAPSVIAICESEPCHSPCTWSSPSHVNGAAKAAGGIASLNGYSKQGVVCVQVTICVGVLAFSGSVTFKGTQV
jgi:hypothetical protein